MTKAICDGCGMRKRLRKDGMIAVHKRPQMIDFREMRVVKARCKGSELPPRG